MSAELRADEDEPVTDGWMYSLNLPLDPGWGFRIRGEYGNGVYVANSSAGWKAHTVGLLDDMDEVSVDISLLPTRGHVRRFCAALGIPLKEQP